MRSFTILPNEMIFYDLFLVWNLIMEPTLMLIDQYRRLFLFNQKERGLDWLYILKDYPFDPSVFLTPFKRLSPAKSLCH